MDYIDYSTATLSSIEVGGVLEISPTTLRVHHALTELEIIPKQESHKLPDLHL